MAYRLVQWGVDAAKYKLAPKGHRSVREDEESCDGSEYILDILCNSIVGGQPHVPAVVRVKSPHTSCCHTFRPQQLAKCTPSWC